MDMLDYCKTYTMVKSSYTNQESTEITLQDAARQTSPQQKYENNGDQCVVKSGQSSTKPADLREPHETGENKLNQLKDVARNKGIISSMNVKSHQRVSFDSEFTFAPKLNALSIKLAKERGDKLAERRNYLSSARPDTEFTFKPKVSSNSVRIMQHLKTTFMDRQQMHVEKQKRYIEATINSHQTRGKFSPVPSIKSPTRLKKIRKIKDAGTRETSFEEEQLLLSVDVKPCHASESTAAPELLPALNSVVNKSTEEEAVTHANASHDAENILDESNSRHLTSPSSSDFTEKTPTCNATNGFYESNSKHDLLSSSSFELTKKTSKVKFSDKMSGSKSDQACKKMLETSPYNQSTENLYLRKHSIKRSVIKGHKRSLTHPLHKPSDAEKGEGSWDDSTKVENDNKAKGSLSRSQSQLVGFNLQLPGKLKYDDPSFDKVRHAKQVAELAIKQKKVFICHGPYPIVRATLRKRGWVEKHYRGNLVRPKNKKHDSDDSDGDSCDSGDDSDIQSPVNQSPRGKDNKSKTGRKHGGVSKSKKRPAASDKTNRNKSDNYNSSSDDGSDDSDDENFDKEDWNAGYEDNGADFEFSLMSRSVRNAVASFIWTTKRDDVDFKFLRKDQLVNHYCKAYSFTTKIGLSTNLRNLKWYDDADHFSFFPRSHLLGSDEEQLDFIDDYRLTAAINIIKLVIQRYENGQVPEEEQINQSNKENLPQSTDQDPDLTKSTSSNQRVSSSPQVASRRSSTVVPVKALTLALEACEEFVRCKEHLDIDEVVNKAPAMSEDSWDVIVEYFYQLKKHGAVIASAQPYLKQCQNTLKQMKEYLPQVDIDGVKNIWIVKPGAKSRGRGIMCMDRLDEIVKLIGNTVGKKEGRLVVQKYIERPLLIHGVKFDIRQWFLVTDWNPLTMWFYQDCYLRFCTQIFSLDDFHISIHLANNSIQKHFENNGMRDKRLPEENMWSSNDFKDYLKKLGVGNKWDDVIYPGMKEAVIHALQSCQEIVEYRKNSFELYGADFIISEDYKPWLLEINCSPTMGASTAVTRKLCAQVLEDTMKVVLDRREDKNCDTGRYELAFKQPQVSAPPYIGINMAVEGQGIQKPPTHGKRRRDISSRTTDTTSLSRPKETRNVILNQSEASVPRDGKRQGEFKGERNVQNTEGSWAVGCMCVAQPIPVATTFYTTDDGKLKGLAARTRTPYSSEIDVSTHLQQRGPKAMKIPKAVLKYASDNSIRHNTQLPISIGPDNSAKQF